MKRCSSCGEENVDRARFCQNCATPLEGPEERPTEVRKVVTIVFSDVSGSTSLGERLDPEALRRVMGRYFDEMSAVIERHGGTVEKFIGDAVMAVFGIPRLHEDDALRAVRAAAGMRQALEVLNTEIDRDHRVRIAARIGVNTGEVVAGDPSAGQRLVTGDAVNVAARLEQAAEPGKILLGETTYRLVKDAVEVEPVEALDMKGKAEPVSAYRLAAVRADTAGHARHLDSPMVGRSKELEMMERALDHAVAERTSHLFTLLGPAGVGKSRLVLEFLGGQAARATSLRGRCLSYGDGITFFPLSEIVQQAAGVSEIDDIATARAKLTTLVANSEDRERIVSLVAGLLAWADPAATEEAFWGVRKLLEFVGRAGRPLIVVIDDIHWAEPTFLDLIEHLADWTRDAALLLVCLARPELLDVRPGWGGGKLNATSILLEPLDGEAASSLVDNLLGAAEIPSEARSRILEAAEGNPLFVEEMLAMLIDDRLLRFEDGAWRAVEDLAQVAVPPTIQLLLAARLDRLDGEERAVMERGAVEGKVFHTGAVTMLAPEALRPRVPGRLLALARKELIRPDRAEFPGEDAFRFRHLLIRDAAYQAMPKVQRADLHERFASWLERAAQDRLPEYEEILGHHLEQAYRYRIELGPADDRTKELGLEASRHLTSSAERAHERGDLNAARNFCERCVELSEGADRAHALVLLADVLYDLADFNAALETAGRAVDEAEAAGDRRWALRAELIRMDARGQVDPSFTIAQAIEGTTPVLAELQTIGDDEGRDRALINLSQLAFYDGRASRALEIAEDLGRRAEQLPERYRQAIDRMLTIPIVFGSLRVEQGFAALERTRSVSTSAIAEARRLGITARLLGMAGRFEEARALSDRARQMWVELGLSLRDRIVAAHRAETERLAGRYEDAERYFREAHEALTAVGETGFNSTTCAELALTLCEVGRFDEAETFAAKSRELSSADDFTSQAEWRMAQALVSAHRGEHDRALALSDQAIRITNPTDYLNAQAESHETRGRVLVGVGRTNDARSAFEEALARFERKGNLPAAARVRGRIATLATG